MVSKVSVKSQLKKIGHSFRVFGRAEINELKNILNPGESILQCAYGHYHGGSGILVATDQRILLIDKRPFYLNVESMAYENIKHIDFKRDKLHGVLYVQSGIKRVIFRSVSDARLKLIRQRAEEYIESVSKNIFSNIENNPSKENQPYFSRRPYLNPSWRPHHLTLSAISRRRSLGLTGKKQ
jgi:hypothetical protein